MKLNLNHMVDNKLKAQDLMRVCNDYNNILKNDIILAKGSNSSRVNKLVNLLLKIKRKNLKRKKIC